MERVRQTIILEDEHGMVELHSEDWPCFIEKVLEISEKKNFEHENEHNEIDNLENELLLDVICNLQIFKHLYNSMYNSATDNLQEMILSGPFSYMKSVDKDKKLNGWSFLNFSESSSREIMKAFNCFYYIKGRFRTDNNLISVPDGENLDFINLRSSNQKILPLRLYELLRGTKSQGLVCTQVLCALNIYLGGNQQISKDKITEFYLNLSMQALSKFNYEITLDFTRTCELQAGTKYLRKTLVFM